VRARERDRERFFFLYICSFSFSSFGIIYRIPSCRIKQVTKHSKLHKETSESHTKLHNPARVLYHTTMHHSQCNNPTSMFASHITRQHGFPHSDNYRLNKSSNTNVTVIYNMHITCQHWAHSMAMHFLPSHLNDDLSRCMTIYAPTPSLLCPT